MDILMINLTSVLLSKKEQVLEEDAENDSLCIKFKNTNNVWGVFQGNDSKIIKNYKTLLNMKIREIGRFYVSSLHASFHRLIFSDMICMLFQLFWFVGKFFSLLLSKCLAISLHLRSPDFSSWCVYVCHTFILFIFFLTQSGMSIFF